MTLFPIVSTEAIKEFTKSSEEIIQKAVLESMDHQNEIVHHGENAHRLIKSGFEFTVKMIGGAISANEPKFLDDQASWIVNRLPHDGVSIEYLIRRLKRLHRIIWDVLSKNSAEEIAPYIEYLIERINDHQVQK